MHKLIVAQLLGAPDSQLDDAAKEVIKTWDDPRRRSKFLK